MPRLQIYSRFVLQLQSGIVHRGSLEIPTKVIDVDGYVKDARKSLATATTWDFWISGSEEALTDWDFFWCYCKDYAFFVEFVCDKGAEVGTVVFAKEVPAGCLWWVPTDDAMANYTADFATGTEDVIDTIRIRNASGSTAEIEAGLIT